MLFPDTSIFLRSWCHKNIIVHVLFSSVIFLVLAIIYICLETKTKVFYNQTVYILNQSSVEWFFIHSNRWHIKYALFTFMISPLEAVSRNPSNVLNLTYNWYNLTEPYHLKQVQLTDLRTFMYIIPVMI